MEVKDRDGIVTSFGVTPDGLVEAQTGPHAEESWTFRFDGAGQLLLRRLEAAGTTPLAEWTYEYPGGGIVKVTDPAGMTELAYDGAHRLVSEKRTGVGDSREAVYAWDGDRPSSRTTVEGGWTSSEGWTHDAMGRVLVRTEAWSGGGVGYSYRDETPWVKRTAAFTTTWQAGGRTETRSGTLEVDGLGNLVSRSQGGEADAWTYDALGLLTRELLWGEPVSFLTLFHRPSVTIPRRPEAAASRSARCGGRS